MNLLTVDDLKVSFPTSDGIVQAVRGLSFGLDAGRTLGVVGESGSGKSVTALTLIGLNTGADVSGSAVFMGKDLLTMQRRELQRLRGADIAMVFQDPLSSLHPLYKVGTQIAEAITAHSKVTRRDARAKAVELLRQVQIPQAERRANAYPYELSGGMRQRAMIAMALALGPKLLIADEPTTALDATVQAQLLDLLADIQRTGKMSLMLITHDLGVVATVADDALVMYAGRVAESADVQSMFYRPHHPYTHGLLTSVPSAVNGDKRLVPIVGQPPSMISPPTGCAFHPRCRFAMESCLDSQPNLTRVGSGHSSACFLPKDLVGVGPEMERARWTYAEARRGERSRRLAGVVAEAKEGSNR